MQSDPMLELLPAGAATMPLLKELGDALIQYTPPNFEIIHCEITEGLEQGQRALFYTISCPEFPDDGTTVVNDRVHRAATRLVLQMDELEGAFSGLSIRLERHGDGTWTRSLRPLSDSGVATVH